MSIRSMLRNTSGRAAGVASLPAPVGGWNARDSLANMESTDAVILDNLFPTVSSVNLRGGYTPVGQLLRFSLLQGLQFMT